MLLLVGGLLVVRSALIDVRPFRTGRAVTLAGLMTILDARHGGLVGEAVEAVLGRGVGRTRTGLVGAFTVVTSAVLSSARRWMKRLASRFYVVAYAAPQEPSRSTPHHIRPAMDHIGIDVHKRESQIYILAEGGEVMEQRIRTEPERFAAVLGTRPRARIVIEASTDSEWVAIWRRAATRSSWRTRTSRRCNGDPGDALRPIDAVVDAEPVGLDLHGGLLPVRPLPGVWHTAPYTRHRAHGPGGDDVADPGGAARSRVRSRLVDPPSYRPGSATKTGILRVVLAWYSAYGGNAVTASAHSRARSASSSTSRTRIR